MRTVHDLAQGSTEWHAYRAKHYNASDVPVMLGVSSYRTRADLVRAYALGTTPEVSADTQALFDRGHAVEAAARPIAEEVVGDALKPIVVSCEVDGLPLGASCDGADEGPVVLFEHKLLNKALDAALGNNTIPEEYHGQLEQQLLVTGARKVLFMASNGTRDTAVWAWYKSNPDLRARIIAGWKQFAADVANYQHVEEAPKIIGTSQMGGLPVLRVEASGAITASNFPEYKSAALHMIGAIKTDLQNDEDFADAEQTVKALDTAAKEIAIIRKKVIAGMPDVNEIIAGLDELEAACRNTRLVLEPQIANAKATKRANLIKESATALTAAIDAENERIGRPLMPAINADFAGSIKGKRTVKSMRDALDAELARAKIAVSQMGERIRTNLRAAAASKYPSLTDSDYMAITGKAPDDFAALIQVRTIAHEKAEQERREREEENRIRLEQMVQPVVVNSPASSVMTPERKSAQQAANQVVADRMREVSQPDVVSDNSIIQLVADTFGMTFRQAIARIDRIDIDAALDRDADEAAA